MDRVINAHRVVLALTTLCLLAYGQGVAAQSMRSAAGKANSKYIPPTRQPYNSMARDTTPFNCEQYRAHPHPGMVRYCQGIENMTLRNEARSQGRPAPSDSIILLPGLGTTEAKQLGYTCVAGQAMKRLRNGWEQVSAAAGGWQRCRDG
ncbi:hypothetical protein [Xanthomonas arboricola]|uniref:Secreted protein n=5 Tax=Xanthomonas arboricola TaxID=56448 RepID=A0AAQ0W2H6_9XANT|nr:hypothetical protein [Xanthomonas arboricola]GAE49448.1 hypothetical protein XPU_0980 [Xanthomonas arboricola pv. pruni str. MAFF 311562]GAE57700.1 hypothetical protein XPR_4335 [Xanthomonas arboricola pv. pruni MAFF 301420]GAE58153.1 hypothetical protein XPN_0059 [Xanthomonas arboricola pv. pruni MAFF 301427]MDN0220065.1 hypothetical protein [Xanthomonas arboricola pv. juglandis]MDN0224710.1 hypothetical protein [Xanthomonas arboricola pv. juglandis]